MLPRNNSLYIISDLYFIDFPDKYLKRNDGESRPACFCFQGSISGLYWMVPMSRRIEKYKRIIAEKEERNKPCDICHVIELAGSDSAFVTGDVFPVISKYIEREYTINGIAVSLFDKSQIKEIHSKAKKIIKLTRNGVIFNPTQPDILSIESQLIDILKKNI